jgi:hypothetical protein
MSGSCREYNWSDILKLIMKDAGLEDEVAQRTRGQAWYAGGFTPPTHEKDTCVMNRYR